MSFPEVTTWTNNLVALLQLVGGSLIVLCLTGLGITLIVSFGNEQRVAFVRVAAVMIVIGMFVLIGAPRIAVVLQSLVAFMNPTH